MGYGRLKTTHVEYTHQKETEKQKERKKERKESVQAEQEVWFIKEMEER